MDFQFNDSRLSAARRIGSQPIAIAAATLVVIMIGIASILVWRSATGTVPEQDRITKGRLMQAHVAQISEQMVAKAKDLELSQQQSIDQLQVVQDQLSEIRKLLAAQRLESKRLSEQVGTVTESLDGLRQSFASTQATEAAPSVRHKPVVRHKRVHSKRTAKKPRSAAARRHGKPRS